MSTPGLGRRGLAPDFMIGVATADHQCEAYDSRWEDIHDLWERSHGRTARGRATDFWNKYREDVELAKSLGCTAFRMSLAWARLEPEPGKFSESAFVHYRELITTIRAAGMEPIITLHHFDWPPHLEKQGGMTDPGFPAQFELFVNEVADHLGDLVTYWITFNEPNILIGGYLKPWWQRDYALPPGLHEDAGLEEQCQAIGALMRNLFQANALGRSAIKRRNPQAMVSVNAYLLGMPPFIQSRLDRSAEGITNHHRLMQHGRRLSVHPWPEKGKVDVVLASLAVTQSNADQIDFSEPYYVHEQGLLVNFGSKIARSEDLAGAPVAVVKGRTLQETVPPPAVGCTMRAVSSYEQALRMLDKGEVVAVLGRRPQLVSLAQRHADRYRLLSDRYTSEAYAVAMAKGNPDLLVAAERAVRVFKSSGAWNDSHRRHFPDHAVVDPPAHILRSLSHLRGSARPTERAHHSNATPTIDRIRERGYLIAAVTEDEHGLGYREGKMGELSGLEIDIARAIAREIFGDPDRVRFRPLRNNRERVSLLRSFVRLIDTHLRNFSVLTTALNANWWHLGMAGRLPEFLCPHDCVGQQDFVGFDYYWGIDGFRLSRAHRLLDAASGRFDRAPVYPGGLYRTLKYLARLFPGQPVMIVENGSVEVADGVDRAEYLTLHLREVESASRDGVNVLGYICWSLTSNREWGLPFRESSDFGLFHIELDSDAELVRIATPAAKTFQALITAIREGKALV